ncbi:MAG TPA: helix-turn-helix domain-containing protein [Glaciihabitans sp.]|jgi:AcrR family transcriptional regulator|nr:helix-turn-helix domain-containing protein [Glaciihabitans sp.]
MSRWAPDAALRLESAALELFAEQGYTATTVPQITARAGLTTRTFFRHFADKRDVLFLREREFPEVVEGLLATAPVGLTPINLVMFGFEIIAERHFGQWRQSIAARQAIIRSDAQLRERELLKSAMLADAIEAAIIKHGVDPSSAALLAPFGVMVFDIALTDWLRGEDRPLVEVLRETRSRMRMLL